MRSDYDPDSTKLGKHRAAVVTILTAFDFFLPQAERPSSFHVSGWLQRSDLATILSLIERFSQMGTIRSPRHRIFSELQKGGAL
jgi:hypothetical protein